MEGLKRHVCRSQGRRSGVGERQREKEKVEMPLCLYECLKAVGLQHHYASFTSVGVQRAAHLSVLTMEDYPLLGIRSMEDRTRLFHLVQMVKTLDLEYENDDNAADVGEEVYVVTDSSLTYDGCEDPDVDPGAALSKLNGIPKPSSVRRRLEFGCESVDHHLKPRSYPEGAVHVYASHNNVPVQGKESCTPVQLDPGSAEVCICKGKNNQLPDFHHQSDHHTGESIMEGNYSHRLSPKCHSFNKPRPAASNRFNKNLVGKKDGKGISRKEKVRTKISSHRASEHTAKPTPVYQSKRTAGYNYGLPLSAPSTGKKPSGGQRISVCVRKRPLTHTECRTGETDVVTTPSGESVIVHESKEAVDLSEYILQHRFYFDQVFGEESSNMEVYQRTAYPLVQHMLNGGKATCFAYGQTGAGKTHTMLGSAARPGLYSLAVRDIFSHLSTTHLHPTLLVYVSFFEIYCGQLYDLLDHRKRLFAREDGQNVVHIVGLRDVRVDSVTSLLEVISQGTEERTQGMSAVNPLSSRSHALLQIQLRDTNQMIFGRMWFVDLAGSERASDTRDPDKQSRMEGAEINQSLLALKECIRSLDQEQAHTPFRQSKLTQVLKDSFVGDSMTCMIANISPGHSATEHTLNTLRYADRVKELRGHGGRRGKTIHSSRHNLINSSSTGGNSIGTRGKSPPKKPKLGRQREDFGPTTPTMRSPKGGSFFCSTPKNSRWGDETSTRKEIGLEHITPVRDLLGRGDKRERADGRKGRRRERNGVTGSDGHLDGDHNVSGQATDEQYHLWEEPKKSGFYLRERQNQQITLNQGENEGRRQVESSRNTVRGVERGLQKADERNEEREKHLRKYHQQLQQFMPPSASSSSSLSSPSTSFSSSVSPSSPSSLHSVSGLRCHAFGEVLDAYRAQVEVRGVQSSFFPSGGICLETKASPIYNNKKDEVAQSGVGKELRVSREVTEPRFVQDGGKHEKRGSLKAAGRELGGEETRRWATTTEWADGMTGAWPADVEALVSCNCDSGGSRNVGEEERDAADVPADGSLITEERKRADACSFLSTHSDSGIFTQSPAKSSYQRAPAERPLSPVCGHTNAPLTPNKPTDPSLKSKHTTCPLNTLQKAQQGVPISSCREKTPGLAAHANRTDSSDSQPATLPPTTPTTQTGCKIPPEPHNVLSESPAYATVCKHPEVNAKMSVLIPPEETADTHSYLMDPISMSLLHVDRRVATAEQNQISLCPLEKESRKDNEGKVCVEMVRELEVGEDIELSLSLLELPQATSIYSHNSVSSTVTNHIDTMPKQRLTGHSNISPQPNGPIKPHSEESNACKEHISPIFHLSVLEDLDHGQCGVVQAHWKQLEEMEALFHKEGTLLSHQPDMAFVEYVHKLEDILERKARCVLNMMAQLQPYLQPRHSDQPIK